MGSVLSERPELVAACVLYKALSVLADSCKGVCGCEDQVSWVMQCVEGWVEEMPAKDEGR